MAFTQVTPISAAPAGLPEKQTLFQRIQRELRRNKYVYIMVIPVVAYYLLFCYGPMYGAQIAFRSYSVTKGIANSPWVGGRYFVQFFTGPYFFRLMRNTLLISLYQILFAFPAPIILALMLNEIFSNVFKRVVQTVAYLPHFISMVVICSLIRTFVARDGIVTDGLAFMGLIHSTNLLGVPGFFRAIYIVSGIWQEIGWGAIIYLSALAGIDTQQYEAAVVDGANRFHQLIYVTLPGLLPTIVTMFILKIGQVMSVGSEKILLLYNTNIYETADVISTYVYRVGIEQGFQLSYTTAVGLFTSVINFALVVLANGISRKVSDSSLW